MWMSNSYSKNFMVSVYGSKVYIRFKSFLFQNFLFKISTCGSGTRQLKLSRLYHSYLDTRLSELSKNVALRKRSHNQFKNLGGHHFNPYF